MRKQRRTPIAVVTAVIATLSLMTFPFPAVADSTAPDSSPIEVVSPVGAPEGEAISQPEISKPAEPLLSSPDAENPPTSEGETNLNSSANTEDDRGFTPSAEGSTASVSSDVTETAPTATISGSFEKDSKLAPGTIIFVAAVPTGAGTHSSVSTKTTFINGHFRLENVPLGSYNIEFLVSEQDRNLAPQYYIPDGNTVFSPYLAYTMEVTEASTYELERVKLQPFTEFVQLDVQPAFDPENLPGRVGFSVIEKMNHPQGDALRISPDLIEFHGSTIRFPIVSTQSNFIVSGSIIAAPLPGVIYSTHELTTGPSKLSDLDLRWKESEESLLTPLEITFNLPTDADMSRCTFDLHQFNLVVSHSEQKWTVKGEIRAKQMKGTYTASCSSQDGGEYYAEVTIPDTTDPIILQPEFKKIPPKLTRNVLLHTEGEYASWDPEFTPRLLPLPDELSPKKSFSEYRPSHPGRILSNGQREWVYENVPTGRYNIYLPYMSLIPWAPRVETVHYFKDGPRETADVITVSEGSSTFEIDEVYRIPTPSTITGKVAKKPDTNIQSFSRTRAVLFRQENGKWKPFKHQSMWGDYLFENILPGTYTVGFRNPLLPEFTEDHSSVELPPADQYPYCESYYGGVNSLEQAKSFTVSEKSAVVLDTEFLSSDCANRIIPPDEVTISVDPRNPKKLSAVHSSWRPEGVKLSYQWYSNGTALVGQTDKDLHAWEDLKGTTISVIVTGVLNSSTVKLEGSTPLYYGKNQTVSMKSFEDTGVLLAHQSIQRGRKLLIEVFGFAPHEQVALHLHSDPLHLTTLPADANGHLETYVTIPASAPLGAHHIRATGQTSGKKAEIAVELKENTSTSTTPTDPASQPSGTTPPSTDQSGTEGKQNSGKSPSASDHGNSQIKRSTQSNLAKTGAFSGVLPLMSLTLATGFLLLRTRRMTVA